MKGILFLAVSFLLIGCSGMVGGINTSNTKEIESLIAKKDKRIEELSRKIADLEAKKDKYQEDLETYNNNPVLDELDEILSDKGEEE